MGSLAYVEAEHTRPVEEEDMKMQGLEDKIGGTHHGVALSDNRSPYHELVGPQDLGAGRSCDDDGPDVHSLDDAGRFHHRMTASSFGFVGSSLLSWVADY